MTIVSCSGKFHAFALAEQLHKYNELHTLYTMYAYAKNTFFRKIARRVDNEVIPTHLIKTNIPLAILTKAIANDYKWNNEYDKWVAKNLKKNTNYDTFIGWSCMSLHCIRVANAAGKISIVERGSTHILFQNQILTNEFAKYGIKFSIDNRVIEKEMKEYEEANYISVPSNFVKNTFIENGVKESKIFLNAYGTSSYFKKDTALLETKKKFRILYLGSLTIRKGLIYLFEAIKNLNINTNDYEIWFIGQVADELKPTIEKYKSANWVFHGLINHYELPKYISVCDVAIHPSIEEGLSMVIAQIMSCGVPVVATTNTGGADIIEDGKNGFIVPIQTPNAIRERIEYLYNNKTILQEMKNATQIFKDLSWDAYGARYINFIKNIAKPQLG